MKIEFAILLIGLTSSLSFALGYFYSKVKMQDELLNKKNSTDQIKKE